jgi:hypothetical protein
LGRRSRHPQPNDFVFDVAVLNLVCFGHLTRRANQGHIGIIADIIEPAPETAAGFFISQDNRPRPFQFVETVSSNFPQFVESRPSECSEGCKPTKPVACSASLYCDRQFGGVLPCNHGSTCTRNETLRCE